MLEDVRFFVKTVTNSIRRLIVLPNKPLEMLIDDVIENEINMWTEQKQRDAEQLELIEESDEI
jgi:hypothetical protein